MTWIDVQQARVIDAHAQPEASTPEDVHLQITPDYIEYGDKTCKVCGVVKGNHSDERDPH